MKLDVFVQRNYKDGVWLIPYFWLFFEGNFIFNFVRK